MVLEDIGQHVARCQISIREYTSSITWLIAAEEIYLSSFTPDSLELNFRHNRVIDFGLDVRAIEGIDPVYNWELTAVSGDE